MPLDHFETGDLERDQELGKGCKQPKVVRARMGRPWYCMCRMLLLHYVSQIWNCSHIRLVTGIVNSPMNKWMGQPSRSVGLCSVGQSGDSRMNQVSFSHHSDTSALPPKMLFFRHIHLNFPLLSHLCLCLVNYVLPLTHVVTSLQSYLCSLTFSLLSGTGLGLLTSWPSCEQPPAPSTVQWGLSAA